MSTVFLAELDRAQQSSAISRHAPNRLVIKFIKPSIERHLTRMNLELLDIANRESAALNLVMGREVPTEFIISLYGRGSADVIVRSEAPRRLPWLALELVEGDGAGATLTERVQRAQDGIDPVRALRLTRGMIEGVKVFHELGILHRDLKPDNVFIAGPIDDETPKLADCGIARVEGLTGATIAGMAPEYAGPEQVLSAIRPTARNPLVGPWTDVHALAATVWFILAGEPWHRTPTEWDAGGRRSLRTARRLHRGLMEEGRLLDAIDAVLRRGAAHPLPARAWESEGAGAYEKPARQRFQASMFGGGATRHETVGEFAAEVLPLLEECEVRWKERAGKENRPVTQFRPTRLTSPDSTGGRLSLATTREFPIPNRQPGDEVLTVEPGGVAFLPGRGGFARCGESLVYFSLAGETMVHIRVSEPHRRTVGTSQWLTRGPAMGIAMIGPEHVLLLRRGNFVPVPLPQRAPPSVPSARGAGGAGGEVGAIQAVVGDGRVFGVVTAETDDSHGGPELWRSTDGSTWTGPTLLPLGGEVHALTSGPFGLLIVGSRGRKWGRALFLSLDEQTQVFARGVNDKPPLTVAVSSATREAWAAGMGIVLRFDPGGPTRESIEVEDRPVAMGLDLVGIPWLVTERAVLRRHEGGGAPVWKVYAARHGGAPPLAAIGFSREGAWVLDARGGGVVITPHDIEAWR